MATTEDLWCSQGSVSSLPGSFHPFPEGTCCDDHADRPAVKRIQGETDSMGCEYFLVCQECFDKYKQDMIDAREEESYCEWCKTEQKGCTFMRDIEEGSAGRVYNVCGACRGKYNAMFEEEALAFDDMGYNMHDDDFDPNECDVGSIDWDDEPEPEEIKTIFVNSESGRVYTKPSNHHRTVVVQVPKRISRKKLRKLAQEAAKQEKAGK